MNDPAQTAYSRTADDAVRRLCGVGYADLVETSQAIDPNGAMLRQAERNSIAPDEFARALMARHDLRAAADLGPETAQTVNLFRAALIDFVAGSRTWKMTEGGAAELRSKDGIIVMDIIEKDGKVGFGLTSGSDDTPYVRLDIVDAVRGFMERLRLKKEHGVEGPEADAPSPMRMG